MDQPLHIAQVATDLFWSLAIILCQLHCLDGFWLLW